MNHQADYAREWLMAEYKWLFVKTMSKLLRHNYLKEPGVHDYEGWSEWAKLEDTIREIKK